MILDQSLFTISQMDLSMYMEVIHILVSQYSMRVYLWWDKLLGQMGQTLISGSHGHGDILLNEWDSGSQTIMSVEG